MVGEDKCATGGEAWDCDPKRESGDEPGVSREDGGGRGVSGEGGEVKGRGEESEGEIWI